MWGSILLNILCSVSAAPSSIVFFVLVQGTVHVRVVCLSVPTVCGLYSYHLSEMVTTVIILPGHKEWLAQDVSVPPHTRGE